MASRLPVVIAQHALRHGRESQLEETLVAELIFASGLDATLVEGLDRIVEASTDHLCLEGLMGDYALLSWSTPDILCEHLNRLGIQGQLIHYDAATQKREARALHKPGPKKIHFLDLNAGNSADEIMRRLRDLLEVQNTRVVTLGPPKKSSNSNERKPASLETQAKPTPTSPTSPTMPSMDPESSTPNTSNTSPSAATSSVSSAPHLPEDEEEWSHLDKLVDDLDAIM